MTHAQALNDIGISGSHAMVRRYARYATRSRHERLVPAVAHHAKRALLDWLGASLAGMQSPEISQWLHAQTDDLDHGKAMLLNGRQATPRAAAMIHGAASHVLELDDIFRDGLYHPGGPVIATALAVAQEQGVGGEALLRAIVAGYEISTRISAAVNPHHYTFWHTTGTVGGIGAAAAAAMLYDLDESAFADALAHACSCGAGLQQAFRSSALTKPLHVAHAADVGIWSARAARAGFNGAHDILEGAAGFGAAMGGSPDWAAALDGLGERFNIGAITFKPYACCGQTFAAIDALRAILEQTPLHAESVASITVDVGRQTRAVTENATPVDAAEARFSMAFVLSSTFLYGPPQLTAFAPERLSDMPTRALMPRIGMRVDEQIDAAFPKLRSARVTVDMHDGTRHVNFQLNRRGDPEWPLDDAALVEKFMALTAPCLGVDNAARLCDAVQRIETWTDLTPLIRFLSPDVPDVPPAVAD